MGRHPIPLGTSHPVAAHAAPMSLRGQQPNYGGAGFTISAKAHGNPADGEVDNAITQLKRALRALDNSSAQTQSGTVQARELEVVLRSFNVDSDSKVVKELVGRCSSNGGIDYHRFTALLSLKLGLSGQVSTQRSSKSTSRAKTAKPNARFKNRKFNDTFERTMPDHFTPAKGSPNVYDAHTAGTTFGRVVPDWDLDHYGTVENSSKTGKHSDWCQNWKIAPKNAGEQTPAACDSFKWFQHIKTERRPTSAFVTARPTSRGGATTRAASIRQPKVKIPTWETTMKYRGRSARARGRDAPSHERHAVTKVGEKGSREDVTWDWGEDGNVYEIDDYDNFGTYA